MDNEILDVVDGHDRITGTVNRKDYKQFLQEARGFIRASELFIMNDAGKLWVPVRASNKTIAPNGYDYSAAGHVESGGNYLGAMIREAQEEIGLQLREDQLEFFAKLKTRSIRYICCVYLLRSNQAPVLNPHDFQSAEWLTPAELLERIDGGHPAKSNLREAVLALQAYLAD
ncbi:MAG TPA: NUDIX domain-containing protein [Candidatus Saccharimonadales bacterium]|nr:NUDIX domain-containing protein [Candidatus Saccharimonadales bacterium]